MGPREDRIFREEGEIWHQEGKRPYLREKRNDIDLLRKVIAMLLAKALGGGRSESRQAGDISLPACLRGEMLRSGGDS